MNTLANLFDNRLNYLGTPYEVVSPVTGNYLSTVPLVDKELICRVLSSWTKPSVSLSPKVIFAFLHRLQEQLRLKRELLYDITCQETGFIARDSRELVDGSLEYLQDFEIYVQDKGFHEQIIPHSYSSPAKRDIRITQRPYRCIAAVVPQNASLPLSVVMIVSALYAGSRIILRPSLQNCTTGSLLAEAIMGSDPPESRIAIVNCLASDFIEACCSSPSVDLIHYIGSNQYAQSVFSQAFSSGKICLLDGQGNGLLYLDQTFPLEEAIRIITAGATHYNGETCTSINGVLIEESLYDSVKEALIASFSNLRLGHPLQPDIHLGPLFSEKQARALQDNLKETIGLSFLCGGKAQGAYFPPTIVEGVHPDQTLVKEGFFGPTLWIQGVTKNNLWDWLKLNQFPLSDTILSHDREMIQAFAGNSRAARICINEDPSIESMFEPWGGYPPSGLNPVSVWIEKYKQTVQLDGKLREIMSIPLSLG